MKARIAVLGGDGIGPEVTAEAVRVLQAVASKYGHDFEFSEALIGGAAIDASGSALPPRTIDACRESAATLLGAVGGPKWSDPGAEVEVDLPACTLRLAEGRAVQFPIESFSRYCLMNGIDELGYLLNQMDAIERYERAREGA